MKHLYDPLPLSKTFTCEKGKHYFREGHIPPGTLCICGQKVVQYDKVCACCDPKPVLVQVRELQEGDIYV